MRTILIVAIVAMLILTGCRSSYEAHTEIDHRVMSAWREISPKEFPAPVTTPYDNDYHARALYLQGYEQGLKDGILALRTDRWHIGDVIYESEDGRIIGEGWRAAGLKLLDRNEIIISNIVSEINSELENDQ